jgi:hypothetical protein
MIWHPFSQTVMNYIEYKKKDLVKNKSNLLLKIILYNTLTLQLFSIKTKLD